MARWCRRPDRLPAVAGAYALLIDLGRPAPLPPRFAPALVVAAGAYLYLGSARGGGGIRARCARHMAGDKSLRWHVDWLTTRARRVRALAVPGGDECVLAAALLAAGAGVPVPGFGSSDCATCPSHLLSLDPAAALAVLSSLGDVSPRRPC
jgi:Uri superfamily endonuclease